MKNTYLPLCGFVLVVMLTAALSIPTAAHGDVGLMTKEELKALLDDPGLVILDVRQGKDWTSSEFKIQGAIYVEPKDYAAWVGNYPKDKKYVLYCA
jgi:hypothetical protein